MSSPNDQEYEGGALLKDAAMEKARRLANRVKDSAAPILSTLDASRVALNTMKTKAADAKQTALEVAQRMVTNGEGEGTNKLKGLAERYLEGDAARAAATEAKRESMEALAQKNRRLEEAKVAMGQQKLGVLQKLGIQGLTAEQQKAKDQLARAKEGVATAKASVKEATKQESETQRAIAKDEKEIGKAVVGDLKQRGKVAMDNLKRNIFLEKPQVFSDTEDARKELEDYRQWVIEYEKELERVRDLVKGKDDKAMLYELAKYVRPQPVAEEEAPAKEGTGDAGQAGGAYMSRLDRILVSLEAMMATLNDPQNATLIAERQAASLRDRIQELGIMGKQLDRVVQSIDFDEVVGRDFEEQAYDIPEELINRYPPEVIERARAIITIFAFFKNAINKFALAPTSVSICTAIAFLCVLANIAIAAMFLVSMIKKFLGGALIKNPINLQSQDFNISQTGSLRSPYTFVFVVIILLNLVGLVLGILGIVRMITNADKHHKRTPLLVKAILFASTCQAMLGFFGALFLTVVLTRKLRSGSKRIQSFNRFVYANMYKDVAFLKNLRNVPSNSFSLMTVVNNALGTLTPSSSSDDIGKAMFSLNLYMHFQKMGYRNPYLLDALSRTFNTTGLLRKQFFAPANFLHRRMTFIKDNGDVMRDTVLKLGGKTPSADFTRRVDEGAMKASEWTAEANNLANSFYPEDGMRIFVIHYAYIFVAQTLPLLILLYIFRDQIMQKSFTVALSVLFKRK